MNFPAQTRRSAALLFAVFALFVSEGSGLSGARAASSAFSSGSSSTSPERLLNVNDPPIFMRTVPEHITAGEPFWLEVLAGTAQHPVEELFGISFEVRYSNSDIITIPTPDSTSIVPGDFPGGDVIFLGIAERDSGQVGIGLTRKAGSGGVTGNGVVARILLRSDLATPDSLPLQFRLTNIRAQKENGDPIILTEIALDAVLYQPEGFVLSVEPERQSIQQGVTATWEIALRAVGRFSRPVSLSLEALPEGFTGTLLPEIIRPGEQAILTLKPDGTVAPGSYELQLVGRADTLSASAVVRADVVTTPLFMRTRAEVVRSGEPFRLVVHAGEANRPLTDLAALRLTLQASNSAYLLYDSRSRQAARLESLTVDAFTLTTEAQPDSGLFRISIQKKAGAEAVNGFGALFSLKFSTLFTTPDGTVIDFTITGVDARNSRGEEIILTPEPLAVNIHEKLDFTLQAAPEHTRLIAGERTEIEITMATSYSFRDTVALSLAGPPPAGMKVFFLPEYVTAGTRAQMMVFTDSTMQAGSYELAISGRSSRQQKQAAVQIEILPFIDFNMVLTPESREIAGSGETRFHVSVESENTLRRPVILQLEGPVRQGTRLQLDRSEIDLDEVAVLQVWVEEGAATGSLGFRIVGTSENATRYVDGEVIILPPPAPVRPNPFTPNGDGFNDEVIFDFDELRAVPDGRIRIFSLDGRKIQDLVGRLSWDGRDQEGRAVKPGAYLYIVEVDQKVIARGVVGLAR